MIKRILLPLDPSEYTDKALNIAIKLAKYHNAELTGMVILDIPGIESSVRTVPLGASYFARELGQKKIKDAELRIDELSAKFEKACEGENIKSRIHRVKGVPSDEIIRMSSFYDLLVIGKRTFFHFETQEGPGDSFEEILDSSITPILAVPKQFEAPEYPDKHFKALIAFNGTLPSCRALQMFAHLALDTYAEAKIIMSHKDEEYAQFMLREAEDMLKAHGLSNIETIHTANPIIETVDQEMLDWCDLFVMGPHSESSLVDFFTGSFTKYIINHCKKLIFIGQ